MNYHPENRLKIRPGDILRETYPPHSTTYLVLSTDITVPLVKSSIIESIGFKALILHDDETAYPWDELNDTVGSILGISYNTVKLDTDDRSVQWEKEFQADE